MRQDVAIVGDKVGIPMDAQLNRHTAIRNSHLFTLLLECYSDASCTYFTLYLGANLINSLKATSVPTTPRRIP